jgi:5-formyltetrahydrofolate cyclo-ligase
MNDCGSGVEHRPRDVAAQKRVLRQRAIDLRSRLDGRARLAASRRALVHLVSLLQLQPESVVAASWPIGAELDTRPLFDILAALGVTGCLPRMVGRHRPLAFYPHRPGNPLVEGPMRVLEPLPDGPPVRPGIVIVPLLAFDDCGHRLGYGGGFYDRTLAELMPNLVAIGLAFEAQRVRHLPHEPTDFRLTRIVTEIGVHDFS